MWLLNLDYDSTEKLVSHEILVVVGTWVAERLDIASKCRKKRDCSRYVIA